MEKYFDLVLELLELEGKENLKSIALQLEKYQKEWNTISFFHQYDFLFKAWLALCAWEISEEEFVQIWDSESNIQLYNEDKKNTHTYFESLINKNFPEEDVILIDQDAWNLFLTKKEQDEIEKHLNSNSKILYLV